MTDIKLILKELHVMLSYLVKKEKEKDKKKKKEKIYISSKEIDEVFEQYRLYIQPKARENVSARENIRVFLKEFKKEALMSVMEKKSNNTWFIENCAWRGASWFFSNKKRFNTWIEEEVIETEDEAFDRVTNKNK